eukprot:354846-Chlamydomonas_euryale.AAC.8
MEIPCTDNLTETCLNAVGYHATKDEFGTLFSMHITAGPTGPVFSVTDEACGVTYIGNTPTKPWTDVCLARRTGQRISDHICATNRDRRSLNVNPDSR